MEILHLSSFCPFLTHINCFSTSPFSALTACAVILLKCSLCSKDPDYSQMSAHRVNSHKAVIMTVALNGFPLKFRWHFTFQRMSLFGLRETKSERAS